MCVRDGVAYDADLKHRPNHPGCEKVRAVFGCGAVKTAGCFVMRCKVGPGFSWPLCMACCICGGWYMVAGERFSYLACMTQWELILV